VITENDMWRQVRELTGEGLISNHLQWYDSDAIVAEIRARYGLADVEAIDLAEFQRIAAGHDIRMQVRADAERLLRDVRECLGADAPQGHDGRRAIYERVESALFGLGEINVIHECDPDAESDENYDNILSWWNAAKYSADAHGAQCRAKLDGLLAKLEGRVRAEAN
jgi:hypothetical protein